MGNWFGLWFEEMEMPSKVKIEVQTTAPTSAMHRWTALQSM